MQVCHLCYEVVINIQGRVNFFLCMHVFSVAMQLYIRYVYIPQHIRGLFTDGCGFHITE